MQDKLIVSLFDMVMCLSDAADLISQAVNGHHKRVAYIASSIATEMQLSEREQRELIIAGALHDVGAFSLKQRLDALKFEQSYSYQLGKPSEHAELGYNLIKKFEPFSEVASLIRYHHVVWDEGAGNQYQGEVIPRNSHLLHLADRVDVLINKEQEILSQKDRICERIEKGRGEMFIPELVDAFLSVAQKEAFWFNVVSPSISRILAKKVKGKRLKLDLEELHSLAILFSRIIDFRCEFTANHSSGVAATAKMLARHAGLSGKECQMMEVAGHLHDLGKLAVPPEILNKPDKLTDSEFNVIKKHPFYTYRILGRVQELEKINDWAALHHERLDGAGYPFHYPKKELSIGSRMMAVADVFTAITEDRPYRAGMDKEKALSILHDMGQESALDSELVTILHDHYEEINYVRETIQTKEIKDYSELW